MSLYVIDSKTMIHPSISMLGGINIHQVPIWDEDLHLLPKGIPDIITTPFISLIYNNVEFLV